MTATHLVFKNWQGGRDGDVMLDQHANQIFRLCTIGRHVLQRVFAFALAANIRLLTRIQLRVDEEPVLQIVDAQLGGFFICHGAQVAGDFDSAFVGGVNRGLQLVARDVHVCLEGRNAAVGPEVYRVPRVLSARQVRHLYEITLRAFQIRAGHVEMRSGQLAGIDVALQVQIRVSLHAAGGAHSGHAPGQIQAWRGERHLRHQHRLLELSLAVQVGSRDVEEMVVHADDSGHDCVAVKVEYGGAWRCGHVRSLFDGEDFTVLEGEILVFHGWGGGAVDYSDVRQDRFGGADADELLHFFGRGGGLGGEW